MDSSQKIDAAFDQLRKSSLKRCASQEEYELVLRAFSFAREAHKNQKRISGDPIILHCIDVALIVVNEIGLGCKSIVTALLHHIFTDTDYSREEIAGLFGSKITSLVDGLGKLEKVFATQDKTQAETFKQMLLTVNDDARVLLIKLADRLHNLRNIEELPVEKRARNLGESMYIFAPLAHQLGLYTIKSEIENIWMKYVMPQEYRDIEAKVQTETGRRGPGITNDFITPIKEFLDLEGYRYTISTRIKTPYSIWNKMRKRNVPFSEVYDLFAVRIVFEPKDLNPEAEHRECYHIEELLNERWTPNPQRRRDWLKETKDNGYEALHSTYMTPSGNWIEVQIRSKRMDDLAEYGLAAHWKYKGIKPETNGVDSWLSKVRETLEDKDTNAMEFFDSFQAGNLATALYVFTPKGEMRILPKGSTALDFAYYIHSQVGNHALAAKVNQQLVLLSTVLQGGDQVEIITTEAPQIRPEWLGCIHTTKARTLIIDALSDNGKNCIGNGRDLLNKKLEELGIKSHSRLIQKLMASYQTSSKEEMYAKIGAGVIDLKDLKEILRKGMHVKKVVSWVPVPDWRRRKDFNAYHFASCCRPVPEEPLVGFIDKSGDLYIHAQSCKKVKALQRLHRNDNATVEVVWKKQRVPSTLSTLSLRGNDRMGIIHDITRAVTLEMCVNIRKMNVITHDNIFEAEIEVYVQNKKDLENLMVQLLALKGIESVTPV